MSGIVRRGVPTSNQTSPDSKWRYMKKKTTLTLAVLTLLTASTHFTAHAGSDPAGTADQHIAGDRTVLGVVEEIRSDQARILPRGSIARDRFHSPRPRRDYLATIFTAQRERPRSSDDHKTERSVSG